MQKCKKIIAKMQKEVYDFNRKMQQEIYSLHNKLRLLDGLD